MELASMPLLAELFNATSERSPFGLVPVRLNSQTGSTGSFSSTPLSEKSQVSFPDLLSEMSEVSSNSGTLGESSRSPHVVDEMLTPETLSTPVLAPDDAQTSGVGIEEPSATRGFTHDAPMFDRAVNLLSQRRTSERKLDTLEERPVRSSLDLPPDQTSTHSPSPSSLGKVQREAGPIGSDDPASEAKEEVGPRLDEIAESVAVGASIVPELAKPVEISDLLPPAGVPTEADNEYADVKAGSNVVSTSAIAPDAALRTQLPRTVELAEGTVVSPETSARSAPILNESKESLAEGVSAISSTDVEANVPTTDSQPAADSGAESFDDHAVIDHLEKLIAGQRSRIESLRVLPDNATPSGSRSLETVGNFARSSAGERAILSHVRSESAAPLSNSKAPERSRSQAQALKSAEQEVTSAQEVVPQHRSPMPREVPVASRYSRQQFFDSVASAQERSHQQPRTFIHSPEQTVESVAFQSSESASDRAPPVDFPGASGDVQNNIGESLAELTPQNDFLSESNRQPVVISHAPRPVLQSSRSEAEVPEAVPAVAETQADVGREDAVSPTGQVARDVVTRGTHRRDSQHVESVDINGVPVASTASPLMTFPSARKETERLFREEVVSELSPGRARQHRQLGGRQTGTAIPLATSSHEILAGSPVQAVNQMVRVIMAESQSLAHVDNHRFEIRISDPDLGSVSIEIRRSGTADGMEIRVTADSAETHLLLEQHADEMTRSLHEQGVNLTEFDLSHERKDPGNSPDEVVELFEEFERAQLIQESKQAFDTAPAERSPIRDGISFRA